MASRPPARPVVAQPYVSSFYNTADLSDGVKAVNLEYREQNLRDLGREDSLEDYAESEGHSSADTGNFTDIADLGISDVLDTDIEHPVIKKVFGDLVEDPLWPHLHDVQETVQLEPSDWDKLVELVHEHKDVYELFSFHYNHNSHILTMSTPTNVHEHVSNLFGDLLAVCYGGPCVLNMPGFKGVLTADTKRKFVGPLPTPDDPSRHVRKLVGPALLVPDGAVTLRFPVLLQDDNYDLRVEHGEHVVGVFEKGFNEAWDHLVFHFGQYSIPQTLNRNSNELPVFMLTVKVVEHPKYQSPHPSSKSTPEQKQALRNHWMPIDGRTLRKLEPTDPGNMLTGRVTIGGYTFCGELEAYIVIIGFFNEHRAALEQGYREQWTVDEWVKKGQGIKVRKKYEGDEAQKLKEFTDVWKSVFTKYRLRIWEKGGEAWRAYAKAQQAKGDNVYLHDGVRGAWKEYLLSAPFNKSKSEADELPLSDLITAITTGAIATATERFDTFKRQVCGFSPDLPAPDIVPDVSRANELEDDVLNVKRKYEEWMEEAEAELDVQEPDVKRPRQGDNKSD
ncbi:uncharacterized protein B0H18DRAFT_1123398 [Fomitopsis serialis]|uniref:uncharacterized protein n=1 Tax=Fomitopsis serialis TaxID=139415 RepID=UPI0020072552|nr:uncharacterized protein B0H18DRAFT_1123398 [Neoantrodia serialis]KAH9917783.1 hypothetical protein B0H18DRAFT_1123398 [Neoantrodia serialis]